MFYTEGGGGGVAWSLNCLRLCQLKYLSILQVIFRYALAIFKYNEEEILRIHDSVEIYQYLRFFTRMIMDGR